MTMTLTNQSRPPGATAPIPVGVLVIGRKRPGFDQEWNAIIRRKAAAALTSLGFTCVGAAVPVIFRLWWEW